MQKILFIILFSFCFCLFPSSIIQDYNKKLQLPFAEKQNIDQTSDNKTTFSFRIGNVDGDLSLYGYWKIKLGYGAGFTLFPELEWILTKNGITDGLIFEQSRLFSMNWKTDTGIFFHFFINDNVDDTEFTFRYDVGKFFNSFYITNKFQEYEVNPYRSLKGGKPQDINFGFDMGNRIYKGRVDIQFDSVKYKTETFKAGKKDLSTRLSANQYERGIYYYLPDDTIVGSIEVYVADPNGDLFDDNNHYRRLNENSDYILDTDNGFIKFAKSVFAKQTIIYYQARVNGTIYQVGDSGAKANNSNYPNYFTKNKGKTYLIISFNNNFSVLEEKNSYRIANPGEKVSGLSVDALDLTNQRLSGFKTVYDEFTGCIRITGNQSKANIYNIYPFYDNVNPNQSVFYLSFNTPNSQYSKNIIDITCFVLSNSLALSCKPVLQSIKVTFNSILLDPTKYTYDSNNNAIILNFETGNSDIVQISYLTDDEEAYNLTAAWKNDFRLNKYFIIGDSYWYKMPVKLWEESYYDKSHAVEFLYNGHLFGDFHDLLEDNKNGKLGFNLNAGFSMYYPDIKGCTIVEDFEREDSGYKLPLHYVNWFPVNIPTTIFNDLSLLKDTDKGRLYFRNMHQYGNVAQASFLSIYDSSAPGIESYSNGNRIGPYSSSDGFTYDLINNQFADRSNTLSMITEFDLKPNQAVSVVFPASLVNDVVDFSQFTGLNLAIKKDILNGDLRIYVDAGQVTEKYNSSDSTVLKEILDEGLQYNIQPDGITLLKGPHDGVLSTNDFDNNGKLDDDGYYNKLNDRDQSNQISKIIDQGSGVEYITVNDKYNNKDLTILNPISLKNMRGVRVTLYSPTGASGRLIFNEVRFTQSSWIYDTTKSSTAQEISPIEDPYLVNHIFSKENKGVDSLLHPQRFKERSMKLNLFNSDGDTFTLEKNFAKPIDISSFNKFTIFVLTQTQSNRDINLILTDTNGNTLSRKISLKDFGPNEWQRLDYYFDAFSSSNESNKLISDVKIQFLNGLSDPGNMVIYLDEFSLWDAMPSFGFATKNEFIYSEPLLEIKKDDFSIFKSPYLKWGTSFNTPNFLREEFTPYKDYYYNNEMTAMFGLAEINYYIYSDLDFLFRKNYTYNPSETFRLKLSKNYKELSPVFFTLYYDYTKFGYADVDGLVSTSNLSQTRNLLMEVGSNFHDLVSFKFGYDVESIFKTVYTTDNKYYTEYTINIKNFYNRSTYSIYNEVNSDSYSGNFSLNNLAFLLRDDFTKFYYDGIKKGQDFNTKYGFFLVDPIYFSHNIIVSHSGSNQNTLDLFDFNTHFYHDAAIDLYLTYLEKKSVFLRIEYSRDISTHYQQSYNIINWTNYFNEFNNSIGYIMPIIFYPPFSSLYKVNGKRLISEQLNFNLLSDKIKTSFDWSMYLNKFYFLPYNFTYMFNESIVNTVYYNPSYYFSFILTGGGENINGLLNFNMNYSITENIGILDYQSTFNTIWNYSITLHTRNNVEIQFSTSYNQLYQNALFNREIDHKIIFSNQVYTNFFKKNFTTNDKYGVEMTIITEISSLFRNFLDNSSLNNNINKTDNPINIDITPKIGYRFNKNFTLNNMIKLGYTLDYSQVTNGAVHRYGIEISSEGVFTF